ncbi:glycoside hydrolase family protein [Venturia nashicola]|nr:glycoside hydrolase family protein [Venturia nashicola]
MEKSRKWLYAGLILTVVVITAILAPIRSYLHHNSSDDSAALTSISINFDILSRRQTNFVLWIPAFEQEKPPRLVLGTANKSTSPATFTQLFEGPLNQTKQDLFELDIEAISVLRNGSVYWYWFEVDDPSSDNAARVRVTDPMAHTVDYSMSENRSDGVQPASVIKYRDGRLVPCDIDGQEPKKVAFQDENLIPSNNRLVIYELPVSWTKAKKQPDNSFTDVGTFSDVLALFDGTNGSDILHQLGINALELLPVADAPFVGEWGYGTANYFASDTDMGSNSEFVQLIEHIHSKNVRFIMDMVLGFGRDPYTKIAQDQFHIDPEDEKSNPDSYQLGHNQLRDAFGGDSWRYNKGVTTYDPKTGNTTHVNPAWAFHQAHLHRWMSDLGVGGLRLDSIPDIGDDNFLKSFNADAWKLHRSRYNKTVSNDKFLVIGEELTVPVGLITNGSLNALWNQPFQDRLHAAITNNLGTQQWVNDDLEWTVRKMVDSRIDNKFTNGTQMVNYITSHDIEGTRKERLFDFLENNNVTDKERRAKLAFTCLLTAIGIPMIFAGEEFADKMDRPIADKQIDPINWERLSDPWRTSLFNHVAAMVKLRIGCPALGDDDTRFIHIDNDRNIYAWQRGRAGSPPVVVVANLSENDTNGTEYHIPNFPERDRSDWREIAFNRTVEQGWAGREPLYHWEAKVYTYWKANH